MSHSTAFQPPLATIAEMATHPAWTATISVSDGTVTFIPYRYHLPLGSPRGAFGFPYKKKIRIMWDDTEQKYMWRTPTKVGRRNPRPETTSEIRSQLQEAFEEGIVEVDESRFPVRDLSRPVVDRLTDEYPSYYHALQASRGKLQEIDGMGKKRLRYLKEGHAGTGRHHPEWCWLTRCPKCDEEWWSPQDHDTDEDDPTVPEKPTLELLRERVYCPICMHTDIPAGYFTGPYPFTEDVVNQTHTVTEYTSENNSDLSNYT